MILTDGVILKRLVKTIITAWRVAEKFSAQLQKKEQFFVCPRYDTEFQPAISLQFKNFGEYGITPRFILTEHFDICWVPFIIYIDLLEIIRCLKGGSLSIKIIVVRSGIGNPSSNPGRGFLRFTLC